MPKKTFTFAPEWTLTGIPPQADAEPLSLTAHVPGQVHDDLIRAGVIPDPFWRDQAESCQWVEDWDWRYEQDFEVAADFTGPWMVLEFDGLDTLATITLNGEVIGQTDNMFVPHRFDISDKLCIGVNHIAVHFASVTRHLADKPMDKFFACFSSERVYARKMQCGFGWDWVHRFVTAGIWQPARIVAYESARIGDANLSTVRFSEAGAHLRFEVETEARSEAYSVVATLAAPDGTVVLEREYAPTDSVADEWVVEQPELWWPNGFGEQPLYTCSIVLRSPDGIVLDQRSFKIGIRTIALEEIPDEKGSSFSLIVNGKRVFAKGGNWVPADPFPGRLTAETYNHLLGLAQEGGVNMLRSWGGGIYEPDAFWDACDRLGIMVCQDFLLACAQYPEDDPAFMGKLRAEFEAAIRMLRNRASLVLWSGDNELGMNDPPDSPYWGRKIAEEISEPLCAALDPTRPYRKTSPYGGSINNAPEAGDCHLSAWYDDKFHRSDMDDYRQRIRDSWGRFLSESVAVGTPDLETIRRFASEEDLRDPSARILAYHTKDNPYNGIDEYDHYHMMKRTAERLYGASDDPKVFLRRMGYEQYEWMRLVCESLRRRKPDCSGVLFWMFNDCWPACGCSTVDYYGVPKAGFYGMKAGFRPLIACMEPLDDMAVIWISNDTLEPVEAAYSVRFQSWAGSARWEVTGKVWIGANGQTEAVRIPKTDIAKDGVLVCDVTSGELGDRAIYFDGMPRDMQIPEAQVQVERSGNTITVGANSYARVVAVEGSVLCDDNYFDLMPGETKTVTWRPAPGAATNVPPRVTWWNGGIPG